MNNNIDGLGKIPKEIRKFRYEDGFFKVISPNSNPSFIMKKIDEHKHLHLYQVEGKPHLLLTIEPVDNQPKKRIVVDIDKFLDFLKEVLSEVFKIVNRLEPSEPQFIGRKVTLISKPRMFVDFIQKKTAYFDQEFIEIETQFEDIDIFEGGFGVIEDDLGKETDLIFVRSGEIYHINIEELNGLIEKYESRASLV